MSVAEFDARKAAQRAAKGGPTGVTRMLSADWNQSGRALTRQEKVQTPRQPLSFGKLVLAIIVGIIVAPFAFAAVVALLSMLAVLGAGAA